MYICIEKLSLEREVDQVVNDMIQKEGWTRSYTLSVLRSKFETEERHQEVEYVNDLIRKEAEEQEQEPEFIPTAATTTTTTNTFTPYCILIYCQIYSQKKNLQEQQHQRNLRK